MTAINDSATEAVLPPMTTALDLSLAPQLAQIQRHTREYPAGSSSQLDNGRPGSMFSYSTRTSSSMTSSTTSTVIGIGMDLGRVVKRTGEAIIQVAEEAIIWRRLTVIRRQIHDPQLLKILLSDPHQLDRALTDLLELTK